MKVKLGEEHKLVIVEDTRMNNNVNGELSTRHLFIDVVFERFVHIHTFIPKTGMGLPKSFFLLCVGIDPTCIDIGRRERT